MAELRLQVSTLTASVAAPDATATEILTDFAAAKNLSVEGTAQERLQAVADYLAKYIQNEANNHRTRQAMQVCQSEVDAENEGRQWGGENR